MEFNIKFITPLLIHGADTKRLDTVGLTGKALRGCWRFWFRAILGGIVDNISPQLLYEHESQVFGSADENIGAKFRLFIETISVDKPRPTQIAFSSRRVSFWGYPEGSEFRITVRPRKNMGNKEVDVLLATIWVWANLGAIGQRARRGFGSPTIHASKDSRFEQLKLGITVPFENKQHLEDHLKVGLSNVWDIISDRLNLQGASIVNNIPLTHRDNYFRLRSLEQIAVSERSQGSNIQEVLNKVHGKRSNGELGGAWRDRRLASPVFLRIHKVGQDFYPVITWNKLDDRGIAKDWIKRVGCNKYLSGKSI